MGATPPEPRTPPTASRGSCSAWRFASQVRTGAAHGAGDCTGGGGGGGDRRRVSNPHLLTPRLAAVLSINTPHFTREVDDAWTPLAPVRHGRGSGSARRHEVNWHVVDGFGGLSKICSPG